MERSITIQEVLASDINVLKNIKVPVSQINEISLPILRVIEDLTACVKACEANAARQQEAARAEQEAVPEEAPIEQEETQEEPAAEN